MKGPASPAWVHADLCHIDEAHARRTLRVVESHVGRRLQVEGREMLNFSSNDYLGLAGHPELAQASSAAAMIWGAGTGGSRLVTGTLAIHRQLERELAVLKGTDDAVLFSTGYQANVGILQSLMPEGAIFSDELNHASLVDGCRLAGARTCIYRHRDMDHLSELLANNADAARKLIVTDGVFSMDGDLAPLPRIAELAQLHHALAMVDDAHATGVLGAGQGSAHHFGVADRIHIHMGTLGKALGSFGAFAATSRELVDLLINRARSFIFTTALPPSAVGASLAALKILREQPQIVTRLTENGAMLRRGLREMGFDVPCDPTPIISLVLGSNRRALAWSRALWDMGIWVVAIRPPTVPQGSARLRVTVSADHTSDDIAALCRSIALLRETEPDEEKS